MALWTSLEIKEATNGEVIGHWDVDGVSIDTRSIVEGDLFVALSDKRDGHDFVKIAFEKGARAALVSHIPVGLSQDMALVIVADVLKALEDMARFARNRFHGKLIAITGSVGKTSTKEMLKISLKPQGQTHASVKSYNNHWGVPLTLARMPVEADYAIIELGMNQSGEIREHSILSKPNVAIITSVSKVHMLFFNDLEEIALAKSEIFDGLTKGGVAIVNSDIEHLPTIERVYKKKCDGRFITIGRKAVDWSLNNIQFNHNSICVTAKYNGDKFHFNLNSLGEHFAINALATLAAVNIVTGNFISAIKSLNSWRPPSGRGEHIIVKFDNDNPNLYFDLIDDSYNSNPTSLKAGLMLLRNIHEMRNVSKKGTGKRIAILGDMLELGSEEIAIHEGIANWQEIEGITNFYLVGPLMKSLDGALPDGVHKMWFKSSSELASFIISAVSTDDVFLVKGSNSVRMIEVVNKLKNITSLC
jgi:UDP-N-acetylmuramoyl-tripeptide--D-alanyl-D-alanine ligase